MDDAAATADGISGLGGVLRQARQTLGLTPADLAHQLNLDTRLIEALEREDKEALPAAVYVRGYLRRLAATLKLDEAELQQAYLRLVGTVEPVHLRHTPPIEAMKAPRGTGRRFPWAGLVLVLGVVAAGIYGARFLPEHWLDGPFGPPAEEGAMLSPVPTLPVESASVPLAPSIPLDIEPPPEQAPVAVPMVGEVVAPVPAQAEAQSAEPAAMRGLELRVTKGESWVQVKDAGGHVLLEETLKSGTVRQVEGARPLQVVIGNRAALTLSLDGKPVDLAPYGRPNGKAFITKLGG